MSSYYLKAKHKITDEIKTFEAIDDFYGKHQYGYRDDEGTTYNESGFCLMFDKVDDQTITQDNK
jgi:hypothetical protein